MKGMGASAATRGAKRSEGVVGVTPTGIELGLKVGGIGQLGISTDYGGGIVVGAFGQKIVWGREGGKIYYNFGGLKVIVEARNCVVVETRKIFGQVTGRHVYPDPGCKLPPDEPDTSKPAPLNPNPDDPPAVEIPDTDVEGWVFLHVKGSGYDFGGWPAESITTRKILSPLEERVPRLVGKAPVRLSSQVRHMQPVEQTFTEIIIEKNGVALSVHKCTINDPITNAVIARQDASSLFFTGTQQPLFFWGRFRTIKNFIALNNENIAKRKDLYPTTYRIVKYIPFAAVPYYGELAPPLIQPSAGNQPPMNDSCCEALSADMADLKEVFAVKQILAGKLTVPWAGRMPGAEGEEIIFDYPNLLRAIWQAIDHLGIHPPKLTIKDINAAVAGDQSLVNQFPSATQAFEALLAQVWDDNADGDIRTNLIYRLAWLTVQLSFNLASVTGSVECLKDMLGGETEPLETTMTTPFNIAAGTEVKPEKATPNKGFGKDGKNKGKGKGKASIDNRIDINTEMATESMLPEFMKVRENPVLIDTFTGKQDIFDMLMLIRADLEALKNR